MKETIIIFLGTFALLVVAAIVLGCVAIAWCHYPQGIRKAMKQKREQEKNKQKEKK